MSWGCKYQTELGVCLRLKGECVPGIPGCVLYGKVVMAPEASVNKRRAGKKKAAPEDGTATYPEAESNGRPSA